MTDKKTEKAANEVDKPDDKEEKLVTVYTKGRKPKKMTKAEAAKRLKAANNAAKPDGKPDGKGQSER